MIKFRLKIKYNPHLGSYTEDSSNLLTGHYSFDIEQKYSMHKMSTTLCLQFTMNN